MVVLGCKTVEYVDPSISTLFLVIGWDGDAGATLRHSVEEKFIYCRGLAAVGFVKRTLTRFRGGRS